MSIQTVTDGTGTGLALGAGLTLGGSPLSRTLEVVPPVFLLPVTTFYTVAGAIAVTDNLAVIVSATPVAMTLGAGLVDGHTLVINNNGLGAATITLGLQGGTANIVLPQLAILAIAWNAAGGTWLLTSAQPNPSTIPTYAVTNYYFSAPGAIAVTDAFALLNFGTPTAMTLGAGLVDGHGMLINNFGPAACTVALKLQGTATTQALAAGQVMSIAWNVAGTGWLKTAPIG
jgi:hypothetical protein